MEMQTVRDALVRRPLAKQVADALEELIRQRRLNVGDPLPPVTGLMRELGVSRNVVREAVADLVARGVLRRGPTGRTLVVSLPRGEQLADLFNLHLHGTRRDVRNLVDLRLPLESTAARLAAANATAQQRRALRDHVRGVESAASDDEARVADLAFHRTIIEASGNELLAIVLEAVVPLLERCMAQSFAENRRIGVGLAEVAGSHVAICDAVDRQDPDAAEAAMRDHLAPWPAFVKEFVVKGRKR